MNQIEGNEFVFTGRISVPRHKAWDIVKQYGGYIGTSVTLGTNYVVVGEAAGQKLGRAEEKHIPIISEESFWKMVKSAEEDRLLNPESSNLTEVTPDELDEPLSLEEFVKTSVCFKCEDCGFVFAQKKEINNDIPSPTCPFCSNLEPNWADNSDMSYNSPEVLQKLIEGNSDIPIFPQIRCPVCKYIIPYSLEPECYYCFHCKRYLTRQDTGDPETTGWRVGLVHDPADLYTLTKPILIGGVDWQVYQEAEKGNYIWNEFGKVIFLRTDELVKSVELVKTKDYYNSFEFQISIWERRTVCTPICSSSSVMIEPSIPSNTPIPQEDWERFVRSEEKRIARRTASKQKRFEERQAKRLPKFQI